MTVMLKSVSGTYVMWIYWIHVVEVRVKLTGVKNAVTSFWQSPKSPVFIVTPFMFSSYSIITPTTAHI